MQITRFAALAVATITLPLLATQTCYGQAAPAAQPTPDAGGEQAFEKQAPMPVQFVLLNNQSIPVTAVSMQNGSLVVRNESPGFLVGDVIALDRISHVFGEKPPAINQGTALVLLGMPNEAIELLKPVVAAQRSTAKFSGNHWIEAARALTMAYALKGSRTECLDLAKEISDATPEPGPDPFTELGKALMIPDKTATDEKATALAEMTADIYPAETRAFASYFRGLAFEASGKHQDALGAFLSVSCLYPSGNMVANAASQLKSADLLIASPRQGEAVPMMRKEALAMIKAAEPNAANTVLAKEVTKRLDSLK